HRLDGAEAEADGPRVADARARGVVTIVPPVDAEVDRELHVAGERRVEERVACEHLVVGDGRAGRTDRAGQVADGGVGGDTGGRPGRSDARSGRSDAQADRAGAMLLELRGEAD